MDAISLVSGGLLALGAFFALTGSVGIVRMPDFYSRLHPAGKADTLAQILILGGLALQAGDWLIAAKLVLLSLLLMLTAPTATHAVTKAAHLDGLRPLETAGSADPTRPDADKDHE